MRKSIRDKAQSDVRVGPALPWRETAYLSMQIGGAVVGVSVTSMYRFAEEGKLKLRTLAGRTLIDTKSLIALIDGAEDWKPTNRGAEARAKRREIARNSRAA